MTVVPTSIAIVVGTAACTIVVNPPLPAPSPPLATSEQVPSAQVFAEAAVERGVAKTLTDYYGIRSVSEVKCPRDQPVIAGTAFSCTALVDGKSTTVPIKVITSDGGYEVGRPD
jgi:hypothetical protein